MKFASLEAPGPLFLGRTVHNRSDLPRVWADHHFSAAGDSLVGAKGRRGTSDAEREIGCQKLRKTPDGQTAALTLELVEKLSRENSVVNSMRRWCTLLWELGPGLGFWLTCTSGIVGILYWSH
jgi:hypothetical protein